MQRVKQVQASFQNSPRWPMPWVVCSMLDTSSRLKDSLPEPPISMGIKSQIPFSTPARLSSQTWSSSS